MTSSLDKAHHNMIEQQIRPWEVLDMRVLDLLARMPRDQFVPEAYQALAFSDIEVPYGDGQAMMAPRVEGRLLQALNLQDSDKVLEIGTGTGFLAACLASMAGSVVSYEIDASLLEAAQSRLQAAGINNVELRSGDALQAEIDGAPFDAIAVTGSLPEIPQGLKELLAVGGRMFVVSGNAPAMMASLVTRIDEQNWREEPLFETQLARLANCEEPTSFRF